MQGLPMTVHRTLRLYLCTACTFLSTNAPCASTDFIKSLCFKYGLKNLASVKPINSQVDLNIKACKPSNQSLVCVPAVGREVEISDVCDAVAQLH